MTGRAVDARGAAAETIRALATVTLDARALDGLGPATIDRLADLVAARLAERRAAGEEPLLSAREGAEVAGVHPETLRRAVREGALRPAGYLGNRVRLRRSDLEAWVAAGRPAGAGRSLPVARSSASAGRVPAAGRRMLGDAVRALASADRSGVRGERASG